VTGVQTCALPISENNNTKFYILKYLKKEENNRTRHDEVVAEETKQEFVPKDLEE
jgi:hypothetical protein